MKRLILSLSICLLLFSGMRAYAVHSHNYSHNLENSYYQVQLSVESRVYEYLDGKPISYRPYVTYGIYQNCTLKCGCGETKSCPSRTHFVRTVGGWAY